MIESFTEYVKKHCPNVELEDATGYAARGQRFLEQVQNGAYTEIDATVISACITWCLIKQAYDNGKPFGKGMFNIAYKDDALTTQLFERLNNDPNSYSRISTHYNDRAKQTIGIDNEYGIHQESIPMPWQFKTACIGLCDEPDGTKSIFFKPETESARLFKNPIGAIKHLIELIKHKISPQKVAGTQGFRETDKIRIDVQGDAIQQGNEIRFEVDGTLHLKDKDDISAKYDGTSNENIRPNYKLDPDLTQNLINFLKAQEEDFRAQIHNAKMQNSPKQTQKLIHKITMEMHQLEKDFQKINAANSNEELLKIADFYIKKQQPKISKFRKVKTSIFSSKKIQPLNALTPTQQLEMAISKYKQQLK